MGTTVRYASYQWLLNGNIIPSATDSTYTVTQNGTYQVIVTDTSGCIDTSDVYTVNNYTGILDVGKIAKAIIVRPNPSADMMYIQSPVKVNVFLTTMDGRVIRHINNARSISLHDLVPGLYLLRITGQDNMLIKVEKIIKAP